MELPEPLPDYWKWLSDYWAERDRWRDGWRAKGDFRRVPRTFREFEVILRLAEQRLLAGDKEEDVKTQFEGRFARLSKQQQQNQPTEFAPIALAQARRQGWKEDATLARKAAGVLEKVQAGTRLKPEDMKLSDKPVEPDKLPALAGQTLEAMLRLSNPTVEQLKDFDEFFKSLASQRYIEFEVLRFLLAIDDVKGMRDNWNDKDLVGVRFRILNAAQSAERAVAIDPRVLPWVKNDLETADGYRREAILNLATRGYDDRLAGLKRLQDAAALYKDIAETAEALETGFQLLEEVHVLLPDLVAPLGNGIPESPDEQLWKSVVASTATLQRFLTPPKQSVKIPLSQFTPITRRLKSDLSLLRSPYDSDDLKGRLRRAGSPNAPTADDLRRLLESPMWNSGDRVLIYAKSRELGQAASSAALENAATLKPGAGAPAGDKRPADVSARRARMAIELLSLDGFTKVGPLNDSLGSAERLKTDEAWHKLAFELRKAWAVTLPDNYKNSNDLQARDQAGFVIHTSDIHAVRETDQPFPGEPTAELRRLQQQDYLRWL